MNHQNRFHWWCDTVSTNNYKKLCNWQPNPCRNDPMASFASSNIRLPLERIVAQQKQTTNAWLERILPPSFSDALRNMTVLNCYLLRLLSLPGLPMIYFPEVRHPRHTSYSKTTNHDNVTYIHPYIYTHTTLPSFCISSYHSFHQEIVLLVSKEVSQNCKNS